MRAFTKSFWGWAGLVVLLLGGLALLGDRWADARARERTTAAARQAATVRAVMLNSELQKFQLLPAVLPEYPNVLGALVDPEEATTARLNETLEALAGRTDAAAIYLMDRSGATIAASNWRQPDSFVGQNYAFRPYFRQAMARGKAQLFALGTVSNRAGLYISQRVDHDGAPLGVLVVKVEFARLQAVWAGQPGITAVVDNHGVVIISSRSDWLFRSLHPLSPAVRAMISRVLQFGTGTVRSLDLRRSQAGDVEIGSQLYRQASLPISLLDAHLINFQPLLPERRAAHALVRLGLGILIVLALLLAGLIFRTRERRAMQRAAHTALEQEVAERTRELRDTNDRLRSTSRERAEADARYRRAREELAQANRLGSIGQITAGVAHEINQPVAAIRTFAENAGVFLDRGSGEKARGNIDTIVGLTDRIGAITAELRAFARRGTPAVSAVELGAVIEGTLLLIGDAVRGAGIRLDLVDVDSKVKVAADRVRLEQILINLIQNAIHALAGRADPVIRIGVKDVTIMVADNGPGIDPAIARDVFTPFVTSKVNGLGLGLGIARDIAREFGGELCIVDSPLGGAAFELRLKQAS